MSETVTIARCEVCGWPLASSRENGCVAGDCSMRPVPAPPAAAAAGGPAPLTEEDGERSAQSLDAAGWHREAALLRRLLALAAHHRAERDELLDRLVRQGHALSAVKARAERAEAEIAELKSDHMEAEDEAARHLAALQRAEAALRRIADDVSQDRVADYARRVLNGETP